MERTLDFYKVTSNEYENSLSEEYKKNNGVFYTDVSLADKMFFAVKKYLSTDSVIIDPCCGVGVFLVAANKYGFTNTYGIDIDNEAIDFCVANIPQSEFAVLDFLGEETEDALAQLSLTEKVDCIIGNPPYVPLSGEVTLNGQYTFQRQVSDMGNNLFIAAILRSLSLLKDGGILSYIIPKNFLHVSAYTQLRRKLLQDYTILSIVDIGSYFKSVRGEQVILTIKNKKPRKNKNKIEIKGYIANRFSLFCSVTQSFYSDTILLFDCEQDKKIYEHLTNTYKTFNDYNNGYVGRGKSITNGAVVGNDIRKFGYKEKSIPNDDGSQIFIQNIYSAEAGVIAAFGGTLEASQTVTIFTDGDPKMCRFVLGILHSRLCNFFLYRYCYNRSRLTMHTDAKYLKKIPLPLHDDDDFSKFFTKILPIVAELESDEYLTRKWFDDMERLNKAVYKIYKLDDELSKYIDKEVQKVQSKRWYNAK
jgi:type I restriction-modification system DNA methylase subunit